jgi:hypothetical protein
MAIGLVATVVTAGACMFPGMTTTVVDDAASATIECDGTTGVTDGCADWGMDVLAQGAPSHTFELEDVVRIRFVREGEACVAEYYLGRYPDDVAWSEETDCREA